MGVYIKSMEMPFTCLTCDFHKCAGGVGDFCSLTKRRQFRFKNRPKGCPLIPVPEPHGRLIDEREVQQLLTEMIPVASEIINSKAIIEGVAEHIPPCSTIIPTSEED